MLQMRIYMDACISNNFIFIFFVIVKIYCKDKKPEAGCREHQKVYLKYTSELCEYIRQKNI